MHDGEMKKHAAKQALEELIDQLMKIEGTLPEDGEAEESPMAEAVEDAAEMSVGGGMSEDDMEEKKSYMQGAKKPMGKKSMMVVMAGGESQKMPAMLKKKMKHG